MYIFSDLCNLDLRAVHCFYDRPMVTTRQFAGMSGYSCDYLRPSRHVRWLDCIDRMRCGTATYWALDDIVRVTHARYATDWTLVIESRDYEVVDWVQANHAHGLDLISADCLRDKAAPLVRTGVVDVISDVCLPNGLSRPLFEDATLPYPLGTMCAPDLDVDALPPMSFACPAHSGTRRARQRVE